MNQMLWFVCDSDRWGFPLGPLYDGLKAIIWALVEGCINGSFMIIDSAVGYAKDNLGGALESYNPLIYNGTDGIVDKVVNGAFVPIAIVILSFVVLYDFISQLMEKNSFHDFDASIFIRFFFKTTVAIVLTTNAMKIVSGLFTLGSWIVDKVISSSRVTENVAIGTVAANQYFGDYDEITLADLIVNVIPCLLLLLISLVIFLSMYIILIGRMVEIFINISVAPITFATITNREFGDTGKNYIKLILSYILQGAFIILAVAIYVRLFQSAFAEGVEPSVGTSWDTAMSLFSTAAYGIVLILIMYKSGNMSKSILNCH